MLSADQAKRDDVVMLGLLAEVDGLRSTVQQLQGIVLTLLNTLERAPSESAAQAGCGQGQHTEKKRRRARLSRRLPK